MKNLFIKILIFFKKIGMTRLFDKENNVIHFNAEVMYCMIAVYHSTVRYTLHHDK